MPCPLISKEEFIRFQSHSVYLLLVVSVGRYIHEESINHFSVYDPYMCRLVRLLTISFLSDLTFRSLSRQGFRPGVKFTLSIFPVLGRLSAQLRHRQIFRKDCLSNDNGNTGK